MYFVLVWPVCAPNVLLVPPQHPWWTAVTAATAAPQPSCWCQWCSWLWPSLWFINLKGTVDRLQFYCSDAWEDWTLGQWGDIYWADLVFCASFQCLHIMLHLSHGDSERSNSLIDYSVQQLLNWFQSRTWRLCTSQLGFDMNSYWRLQWFYCVDLTQM